MEYHKHDVVGNTGNPTTNPTHTHTNPTTAAGSAHTHTLSGTSASGASAMQDVMNPYIGVYWFQYCP